jgi:hypothetical protein
MTEQRGYDDAPLLAEMAKGIIECRYSSVDGAAKHVLGEAAGSNVDRLRRKFRQGRWLEKGRDAWLNEQLLLATSHNSTDGPEALSPGRRHDVRPFNRMVALAMTCVAAIGLSVFSQSRPSQAVDVVALGDLLPKQVPQYSYLLHEGTTVEKPACFGGKPMLWVYEPSAATANSRGERHGSDVEITDRASSWRVANVVDRSVGQSFCMFD